MKKLFQIVVAGIVVALAAGCAYSPQQLNIQPPLMVSGEAFGNGRPVLVSASDQRQNRVLGTLGGMYGASSTIVIANDLETAMTRATNGFLAAQGFVVNSADPSAVQLTVIIEDIRYEDMSEDKLGKDVRLTAVLRAEATRGGETFSGRYQTNGQYRSVTTPDQKDNEKRISDLLAKTIVRMFDDAKLREFLTSI